MSKDEVRVLTVDQVLTLATAKFRRAFRKKFKRSANDQELVEFKLAILRQHGNMNEAALAKFKAEQGANESPSKN
jgi:hypothetical protein